MAIRLPKPPRKMSDDFITGFKVPGIDSYRNVPQPWSNQPVPGTFAKAPAIYGGPGSSISIPTIAASLKPSIDLSSTAEQVSVPAPDSQNYDMMNDSSSTGGLPYVPPVDALTLIYDVVALGFNFFGGQQKAEAERKAAAEKQRYYDDLATYEEKTARLQAYQIGLKTVDLTNQARAIQGEQSVMAAAAGYSGQSLEDLRVSDAMSFRIDKEMIKEASRQALKAGYEKAEQYRKIGAREYEAGQREADLTMMGTIAGIGGQFLGARK